MASLTGMRVAILITDGDEPVVCNGNLVSSRKPDDIPQFNQQLIDLFSHAGGQAAPA